MKLDSRLPLVLACSLLLTASVVGASDSKTDAPTLQPIDLIFHGTSQPLSDLIANLPEVEPQQPSFSEVPIRIRPGTEGRDRIDADPDPVVQWDVHPQLGGANAPSLSFDGLSEADNVGAGVGAIVPPDTTGDVGPDHYVQWINLTFRIYDKSGNPLTGVIPGNTLWAVFGGPCQANNNGDPQVIYDHLADRWLLTQFSVNQGIQCVAVSETANPLGAYHLYSATVTPGGANDYPKFGMFTDGADQSSYLFTTRDFGVATFIGIGAMERDAMLAGAAASALKFGMPCSGADCLEGTLPTNVDGPAPPAGTCPTFVTYFDAAYDDGPSGVDGVRNHRLCIDWAGGGHTLVENPFVAGANFDRFLGNGFSDCITPVFGGEALDCLAAFTMHPAQYRWFGTHASLLVNTTVDADGTNRAGIRWGELRSADGESGWSFFQEGTYAPADGRDRWMGSIAMNGSGDIALGYSAVSGSEFPSIRYVGRMDGDPSGLMSGSEQICHSGGGAQTSSANRWGDYSRMSVDPADDATFWYTQEYYATTGSFDFSTRICSFDLDAGGGGIPCGDIKKYNRRCGAAGAIGVRVRMVDESHSGETVTIAVDGVPHVRTIFGTTAGYAEPNAGAGQHTIELLDPPGCFNPTIVTCPVAPEE